MNGCVESEAGYGWNKSYQAKKVWDVYKWQINEDEQIVFHFSLLSHVTSRDIVEKCGENKQINESIDR